MTAVKYTPLGDGVRLAEIDVHKAVDLVFDTVTQRIPAGPDAAIGLIALAMSSLVHSGVPKRMVLQAAQLILDDLPEKVYEN